MMAELQTRVDEMTTADLAGPVDAQRPSEGAQARQSSATGDSDLVLRIGNGKVPITLEQRSDGVRRR